MLPNGRRVAVKVQRPAAPRQIEADLALLYQAAKIAKERVRALDFVDARELVDEFGRSIRQELDYRHEARNAQTFHRNFAGHPHVRIPKVYLELHPGAGARRSSSSTACSSSDFDPTSTRSRSGAGSPT